MDGGDVWFNLPPVIKMTCPERSGISFSGLKEAISKMRQSINKILDVIEAS